MVHQNFDMNQSSAANQSDCGHWARPLKMEELDRLKNEPTLSEFQQTKFEREARKNWDLFYKRNQTNFFKDRHWTTREFEQLLWNQLDRPEENGAGESGAKELIGADAKLTLFELGCGVGNFFFPLLQTNANLTVYACDFSPRAVDLIRSNAAFDRNRCVPFVADLTDCDSFDEQLRINFDSNLEADLASLIFVLSAVAPCKMKSVLQNAFNVLRSGGLLLFRDYGLYDHAQLRFKSGHKIDDNFYVRQDGTRAYYFSEGIEHEDLKKMAELVGSVGFEILENQYVVKETINRRENINVPRVFIQGKYRKP